MPTLLQLYHRLPPALRSVPASLRGYYLRTWRYTKTTDRLAREFLARDSWDVHAWKRYQDERLSFVLTRAATQVPYYRTLWQERRRRGDNASFHELANWPILEKEEIRNAPHAFVADDCDPKRMFHEHTSGTTGKSLDLWWSKDTVRTWYAMFEARSRLWYGVSRHDRWAILGGQLVTPAADRKPLFWVWNAGLKQFYMSSYHLAPDLIPHYLDALIAHRVTYLFGYTSSLYALAQEVLKLRRRDVRMRVAIANAEPVFDYQRAEIEEAFQCPLRETYGMAELAAAAGECAEGEMHIWPDVGVVELVENGIAVEDGQAGDLVCTGLLNADMPLIRYRVGDRATARPHVERCRCGRGMPMLASIDGRSDDVLYTKDGRAIGRLDPVFKQHLPVLEAQIIQESLDHVRILYVPADNYSDEAGRSMVTRLQERLGPVNVTLERRDELPRTANGKFRAVISLVKRPSTRSSTGRGT
ncbi:MAG: phenylacetate--CoA ligase family protein [Sandaracinaceae bacterium]|nr:phenylacetate--CoA ligase family protein [Sandaracinaceae bacterium]